MLSLCFKLQGSLQYGFFLRRIQVANHTIATITAVAPMLYPVSGDRPNPSGAMQM